MATALTPRSFFWLLLIACIMGANHVAARFAMDHGADVITAVSSRSLVTALVVALIVKIYRVPTAMNPRQRKFVWVIGTLLAAHSVLLYSAVARIPVGLALLAFNTYPLCTALWAAVLYRHRPDRYVLWAMPFILLGLGLALDVNPLSLGPMGLGVTLAVPPRWCLDWCWSSPSTKWHNWMVGCGRPGRWPSWAFWQCVPASHRVVFIGHTTSWVGQAWAP